MTGPPVLANTTLWMHVVNNDGLVRSEPSQSKANGGHHDKMIPGSLSDHHARINDAQAQGFDYYY
jgi:hypothetical protein